MKYYPFLFIMLALALLAPYGCDEGLKPTVSVQVGSFSGTIFYSNWPPRDSLFDLRLVAFRSFPPRDIVSEVILGQAYVYPGLGDTALVPFFVDSLHYTVTVPTGRYEYVVVGQQYGPNVNTDWRLVGQFDLDMDPTTPSPIDVVADSLLTGIDIHVDFKNPPPPPFR
jgi:hypothetical protein